MNKTTPIAIFIVVLLAAGGSFIWFVESSGSSGSTNFSATYNSTQLIVLYANAEGWNYNSSHPNPTLYEKTHVLLEFKVIEQDNLPHTLTINPGINESSTNTVLSVNIPAVTGSVVWVNWSFANPGIYTYWCEVHPETMVGKLVVNSTSSNSTNASVVSSVPPQVTNLISYSSSVHYKITVRDEDDEVW
ncbi:MAG: hypothetical protein M0Z77_03095 [Thermoplasmatales archaeon]|jgi:flagellar basal body-associated protein FliL|nr:hypothetical protein [Candidatus Thermoplasmatota archaeon]MCL6002050.1 hypothetical protein [Candidatus Thermoplasmatota archaeon]MDA8054623.1 hypothetical protein [Thermoplasmatales archaeon]